VIKVSVIIPAYNSSNYLEDALKSVVIQNLPLYEVIVVDDGSHNEEHEAYQRICSKYPFTRLIRKENGGAASARNYGASVATGQLLAFLDCDDTWLENKILSQINFLNTGDADLVLGNILVADELLNVKYKAAKKIAGKKENLISDLFYGNVIMNTPTILVKKTIFKKVNGFDESLKYREDHSFLIDVAALGKIVLDPAFRTIRRERAGSLSSVAGIDDELAKHMPFWKKKTTSFSFLKLKKARKKLVTRLLVFFIRNNRVTDVEKSLIYLKQDSYTRYLSFLVLTKSSILISLIYALRNKIRNALL